jgi:hypothetical protein
MSPTTGVCCFLFLSFACFFAASIALNSIINKGSYLCKWTNINPLPTDLLHIIICHNVMLMCQSIFCLNWYFAKYWFYQELIHRCLKLHLWLALTFTFWYSVICYIFDIAYTIELKLKLDEN